MTSKKSILCLLLAAMPLLLSAQSKFVEHSTDMLCLVPSATGLVKALVEKDRQGIWQLGLSTGTTLVVNYGLEAAIQKDRPDGTGHHAFPSTHTAVAFDGASFLMRRYGWQWGVPAYAVSAYVAWGRVHAKRHDWWDVIGGAAIGAGCAFLYTRPLVRNVDLTLVPMAYGQEGAGLYAAIRF